MKKYWNAFFGRSILFGLALSLIALMAIGVGGMTASVIVAERVQGSGSAINVAGSLRMQSHRMGSMVLSDAENNVTDHHYLLAAITRFEASLANKDLRLALERKPDSEFAQRYQTVQQTWQTQLKPHLLIAMQTADNPQLARLQHNHLLRSIDSFVDDIDQMVSQLEADTERRIRQLRSVLGVALVLTIMVMLSTMFIVRRNVLAPLADLLNNATRIAHGEFTARASHSGEDELGQVGRAFNFMATELSRSYQDLEQRVAEKTEELTRSNQSLGLLYHAIANLHNAPLAPETYRVMLQEIEQVLKISGSMACLLPKHGGPATLLASTLQVCPERSQHDCPQCLNQIDTETHWGYTEHADYRLLTIPLQDKEGLYGMLRLSLQPDRKLAQWQVRLLEALTRHIGIALGIAHKTEQERLLALQEERSIIARELHDSIAQSLSYMKIQASLLQPVLADPERRQEAEATLRDLRSGITEAYRQLRELLATFRLKMEGDFRSLLTGAVDEYANRSGLNINLECNLAGCRLNPNQEIHSLQIVREALSNVIRHAQAEQVWVHVIHRGSGEVTISIADDGIGIASPRDSYHYGMTIMRERAQGLNGQIEVGHRQPHGTLVSLRFHAECTTPHIDAPSMSEVNIPIMEEHTR
jgi:two-component system, NarL family, nitrate/nitrite sensor histidine kinase NarX